MAGSTPASATADAAASLASARAAAASRRPPASLWADAWRRFRRHRMALVALAVLAFMVLAVAIGPLIWKLQINEIDFGARLQTPTLKHPFGTDDLGQDIL